MKTWEHNRRIRSSQANRIREQGAKARENGTPLSENPHHGPQWRMLWESGWIAKNARLKNL